MPFYVPTLGSCLGRASNQASSPKSYRLCQQSGKTLDNDNPDDGDLRTFVAHTGPDGQSELSRAFPHTSGKVTYVDNEATRAFVPGLTSGKTASLVAAIGAGTELIAPIDNYAQDGPCSIIYRVGTQQEQQAGLCHLATADGSFYVPIESDFWKMGPGPKSRLSLRGSITPGDQTAELALKSLGDQRHMVNSQASIVSDTAIAGR